MKLNRRDFIKGLLVAAATAVVTPQALVEAVHGASDLTPRERDIAAEVMGLRTKQWTGWSEAYVLRRRVDEIAAMVRQSDARIVDVNVGMLNHWSFALTDWTVLVHSDRHHREARIDMCVTDEFLLSDHIDVAGHLSKQILSAFCWLDGDTPGESDLA